jgi:hypothetical protein
MSVALHSWPWDSQPQEAADVLAGGISCAPGRQFITNTSAIVPTQSGLAFEHLAGQTTRVTFGGLSPNGRNELSIVWVGYLDASVRSNLDEGLMGNRYSSNGNAFCQIIFRNRSSADGNRSINLQVKENSASAELSALLRGPDFATSGLYVIAGSISANAASLYINGLRSASLSRSGGALNNHTNEWRLGTYFDDAAGRRTRADTFAAFVLPFAIDDTFAQAIAKNPWQLFAPQQIYIPRAAAGGGLPTLSLPRAKSGSITATGFVPQWTAS